MSWPSTRATRVNFTDRLPSSMVPSGSIAATRTSALRPSALRKLIRLPGTAAMVCDSPAQDTERARRWTNVSPSTLTPKYHTLPTDKVINPEWIIQTPRLIRLNGIRRMVVTERLTQNKPISSPKGHQLNQRNSERSNASRRGSQASGRSTFQCTGRPAEPTALYRKISTIKVMPRRTEVNKLSNDRSNAIPKLRL